MTGSFRYAIDASDFNLPLCIHSGQVFRWMSTGNDAWFGIDGPNWFQVCLESHKYQVESNAPQQEFDRLFGLDRDASEERKRLVEKGPEMASYVKALPGLRLVRYAIPSEAILTFLCTSNNNVARITGLVQKLATFGSEIGELGSGPVYAFPRIGALESITEQELRRIGFGYRARSIVSFIGWASRTGDEECQALQESTYSEAHGLLATRDGIGPKLADCICLFGLGHGEAVPIDTHVYQAIVREYFPEWRGTALSGKRYREAGAFLRDRFGDLAGLAQQYLFLENMRNWRLRRRDLAADNNVTV